MTTFSTPAGIPASSSAAARCRPVSGCLLRQLQHDGVAVDERGSHLPGGNRRREVPGRDQPDDAERPPQRVELEPVADCSYSSPFGRPRLAGEVAEDRGRAGRLHARFAQRLAHLARHVRAPSPRRAPRSRWRRASAPRRALPPACADQPGMPLRRPRPPRPRPPRRTRGTRRRPRSGWHGLRFS